MKHFKLLSIGLFISTLSFGQVLKLQTGASFSRINWDINNLYFEQYNQPIIGYSVFAGLDYLNKDYFSLSSNIGLLRKGGRQEVTFIDITGKPVGTSIQNAKLDYLSINTTIDLKYPLKYKLLPFISIGPRLDYLINYSKEFNILNDINAINRYNYGLLTGLGAKYDLNKLQIGLRADYYLNFGSIADWPAGRDNLGVRVTDNTLTINATIGYRLSTND